MKSLTLIFLICISLSVRSEGLYRDSLGRIAEPYLSLVLSSEQKEILKSARYIVLNEEQQCIAKQFTRDTILRVITEQYDDCTCQQRFAIWLHPDSIAIPFLLRTYEKWEENQLKKYKNNNDLEVYHKVDSFNKRLRMIRQSIALSDLSDSISQDKNFFIDPTGNIYHKKERISITEAANRINMIIEKYGDREDEEAGIVPTVIINWPPIDLNPQREKILSLWYTIPRLNIASDYITNR